MWKIIRVVVTFVFGSILLSSLVLPYADAQVLAEDEKGCIKKHFKEKAYAPFRIVQAGDPAIRNSIEDIHQNVNSRWHLDRAEYEDTESPTILNFYTDSVDEWKFTVRTSYRTEAVEPRPVTVSFQSQNVEFLTETFFRTGFDFCIVYFIDVTEAPPEFTEEDFLKQADKIQKENFAVVGDKIQILVSEVVETKNSNNIVTGVAIVLIIMIIVTNALQKRGTSQLKKGLKQERQLLAGERSRILIQSKQEKIENKKFRQEESQKIDSAINLMEIKLNSLLLEIRNHFKEMKNENEITKQKEYTLEFVGPLRPDDLIIGEDGIAREKALHDQIESNKCPYCNDKFGFSQDYNVHLMEQHPKEFEKIKEDNEEAEKQFEDTGKEDPLHLEQAKKFPHFFGLINKSKVAKKGSEIKDKIFKKEDEPEVKDKNYYMKYYSENLKGHSELLEEYIKQNTKYDQTKDLDAYYRTVALSELSENEKKFDPKEELED